MQLATQQQSQEPAIQRSPGISQELYNRISSLERGETFEVDIVGADGAVVHGGAIVTLAGENGSYGAYIQTKGSDTKYYCSGTTADGKHVPPHRLNADGSISLGVSSAPRLFLSTDAEAERILGLENGRRRGYTGSYQLQTAGDGSLSFFYSGEAHQDGTVMGSQTFDHGVWRNDGPFSRVRLPSLPDLDRRSEVLEERREYLTQRQEQLTERLEETRQRYDRIKQTRPIAQATIVAQEGDPLDPDEFHTQVRFVQLDHRGAEIPNTEYYAHCHGKALVFDALSIKFKDELIEAGEVPEHTLRFRRMFGYSQAPAAGTPIDPWYERTGQEDMTEEEFNFLKKYTNTPDGETPSWEGFWNLAKDPALLAKYEQDRFGFWNEFWKVGSDNVFFELANSDSETRDLLGIRAAEGTGPYFNVVSESNPGELILKPGDTLLLVRRNLGDIEIPPPNTDPLSYLDDS